MSDKIYDVPAEWTKRAYVDDAKYQEMYERSVADPDGFWAEQAKRIDWIKPFTKVKNTSFDPATSRSNGSRTARSTSPPTASTAISQKRGDQTAIIWEGDDPEGRQARSPIASCTTQVCRFANVLKSRGVKKGDRVTIYMPMIPEAAYAMLACARIGAVHSVVFGGFSPDSARRPHRGLRLDRRHHRRRRPARRQARCRSRPTPTRRSTRPAASST